MDVRRMCQSYVEARPGKASTLVPNAIQKHCRRLRSSEVIEWCADFEKCLNRLDKPEASLLLLVFGAGYSQYEAARFLRIHKNTANMRLRAAEEKLRSAIEELWLNENQLPNHRQVVPTIYGVATGRIAG